MHAGFSGIRRFVARKQNQCKLIGNCLVFPHETTPSNVVHNFNKTSAHLKCRFLSLCINANVVTQPVSIKDYFNLVACPYPAQAGMPALPVLLIIAIWDLILHNAAKPATLRKTLLSGYNLNISLDISYYSLNFSC